MMAAQIVGGGVQWRAYRPVCDVGLNWHADDAGGAAAKRYAGSHNKGSHPETLTQ